MAYHILKLEADGVAGILTISRPDALNALNSAFFSEMSRMLDDLEKRNDLRGLIITGEGKAFVAGADIAEMVDMDPEQGYHFSKTGHETFARLASLPYPVIAAVNGFALGGGCELAMACDIRVASVNAKFGQPEVNLGLIPGYAGTVRLPWHIGLANALYLLMTGDIINAQEAYRIGLVQMLTEPDQLLPEAVKLIKKIASKGPVAVKTVKDVTRKGMLADRDTANLMEMEAFANCFANGESGEGMKAFLEKRPPKW